MTIHQNLHHTNCFHPPQQPPNDLHPPGTASQRLFQPPASAFTTTLENLPSASLPLPLHHKRHPWLAGRRAYVAPAYSGDPKSPASGPTPPLCPCACHQALQRRWGTEQTGRRAHHPCVVGSPPLVWWQSTQRHRARGGMGCRDAVKIAMHPRASRPPHPPFDTVEHHIPGQACVPQSCVSSVEPHRAPPLCGEVRMPLLRTRLPPPHVAEQSDHFVQLPRTQSTAQCIRYNSFASSPGPHIAKFLQCVHTAHAEAGILTQEYLSPV